MASFAIDVEDENYNDQNKVNDELHFQDIPHSEDKGKKVQTHTFTNFPHTADSDDEAGDKAELLKDEKKQPSFWKFEYYQQFFDVDTHQVFYRVLGSMTPRPGRNFLTTKIRPNPDLYGPFWICTTLVFTTAIAGNLANYLQVAGKGYVWKYDFHKVTFAATAIFSYWWLIPAALFGVFWWRGSQSRYTFLEILSVYGYSLAIYIPISILWTIQYNWLQWLLVIIGAALSGTVLVFTFWPAVREDNRRIAFAVIGIILLFHAALAAGFVLYFFHVPNTSTVAPGLNNSTNISSTQIPAKYKNEIPEFKQKEGQTPTAGSKLVVGPDEKLTLNASSSQGRNLKAPKIPTKEQEKTTDKLSDKKPTNLQKEGTDKQLNKTVKKRRIPLRSQA